MTAVNLEKQRAAEPGQLRDRDGRSRPLRGHRQAASGMRSAAAPRFGQDSVNIDFASIPRVRSPPTPGTRTIPRNLGERRPDCRAANRLRGDDGPNVVFPYVTIEANRGTPAGHSPRRRRRSCDTDHAGLKPGDDHLHKAYIGISGPAERSDDAEWPIVSAASTTSTGNSPPAVVHSMLLRRGDRGQERGLRQVVPHAPFDRGAGRLGQNGWLMCPGTCRLASLRWAESINQSRLRERASSISAGPAATACSRRIACSLGDRISTIMGAEIRS